MIQITFVLMARPGPQTGLLTMWELPYEGAFSGGIAFGENRSVYAAAEGWRSTASILGVISTAGGAD